MIPNEYFSKNVLICIFILLCLTFVFYKFRTKILKNNSNLKGNKALYSDSMKGDDYKFYINIMNKPDSIPNWENGDDLFRANFRVLEESFNKKSSTSSLGTINYNYPEPKITQYVNLSHMYSGSIIKWLSELSGLSSKNINKFFVNNLRTYEKLYAFGVYEFIKNDTKNFIDKIKNGENLKINTKKWDITKKWIYKYIYKNTINVCIQRLFTDKFNLIDTATMIIDLIKEKYIEEDKFLHKSKIKKAEIYLRHLNKLELKNYIEDIILYYAIGNLEKELKNGIEYKDKELDDKIINNNKKTIKGLIKKIEYRNTHPFILQYGKTNIQITKIKNENNSIITLEKKIGILEIENKKFFSKDEKDLNEEEINKTKTNIKNIQKMKEDINKLKNEDNEKIILLRTKNSILKDIRDRCDKYKKTNDTDIINFVTIIENIDPKIDGGDDDETIKLLANDNKKSNDRKNSNEQKKRMFMLKHNIKSASLKYDSLADFYYNMLPFKNTLEQINKNIPYSFIDNDLNLLVEYVKEIDDDIKKYNDLQNISNVIKEINLDIKEQYNLTVEQKELYRKIFKSYSYYEYKTDGAAEDNYNYMTYDMFKLLIDNSGISIGDNGIYDKVDSVIESIPVLNNLIGGGTTPGKDPVMKTYFGDNNTKSIYIEMYILIMQYFAKNIHGDGSETALVNFDEKTSKYPDEEIELNSDDKIIESDKKNKLRWRPPCPILVPPYLEDEFCDGINSINPYFSNDKYSSMKKEQYIRSIERISKPKGLKNILKFFTDFVSNILTKKDSNIEDKQFLKWMNEINTNLQLFVFENSKFIDFYHKDKPANDEPFTQYQLLLLSKYLHGIIDSFEFFKEKNIRYNIVHKNTNKIFEVEDSQDKNKYYISLNIIKDSLDKNRYYISPETGKYMNVDKNGSLTLIDNELNATLFYIDTKRIDITQSDNLYLPIQCKVNGKTYNLHYNGDKFKFTQQELNVSNIPVDEQLFRFNVFNENISKPNSHLEILGRGLSAAEGGSSIYLSRTNYSKVKFETDPVNGNFRIKVDNKYIKMRDDQLYNTDYNDTIDNFQNAVLFESESMNSNKILIKISENNMYLGVDKSGFLIHTYSPDKNNPFYHWTKMGISDTYNEDNDTINSLNKKLTLLKLKLDSLNKEKVEFEKIYEIDKTLEISNKIVSLKENIQNDSNKIVTIKDKIKEKLRDIGSNSSFANSLCKFENETPIDILLSLKTQYSKLENKELNKLLSEQIVAASAISLDTSIVKAEIDKLIEDKNFKIGYLCDESNSEIYSSAMDNINDINVIINKIFDLESKNTDEILIVYTRDRRSDSYNIYKVHKVIKKGNEKFYNKNSLCNDPVYIASNNLERKIKQLETLTEAYTNASPMEKISIIGKLATANINVGKAKTELMNVKSNVNSENDTITESLQIEKIENEDVLKYIKPPTKDEIKDIILNNGNTIKINNPVLTSAYNLSLYNKTVDFVYKFTNPLDDKPNYAKVNWNGEKWISSYINTEFKPSYVNLINGEKHTEIQKIDDIYLFGIPSIRPVEITGLFPKNNDESTPNIFTDNYMGYSPVQEYLDIIPVSDFIKKNNITINDKKNYSNGHYFIYNRKLKQYLVADYFLNKPVKEGGKILFNVLCFKNLNEQSEWPNNLGNISDEDEFDFQCCIFKITGTKISQTIRNKPKGELEYITKIPPGRYDKTYYFSKRNAYSPSELRKSDKFRNNYMDVIENATKLNIECNEKTEGNTVTASGYECMNWDNVVDNRLPVKYKSGFLPVPTMTATALAKLGKGPFKDDYLKLTEGDVKNRCGNPWVKSDKENLTASEEMNGKYKNKNYCYINNLDTLREINKDIVDGNLTLNAYRSKTYFNETGGTNGNIASNRGGEKIDVNLKKGGYTNKLYTWEACDDPETEKGGGETYCTNELIQVDIFSGVQENEGTINITNLENNEYGLDTAEIILEPTDKDNINKVSVYTPYDKSINDIEEFTGDSITYKFNYDFSILNRSFGDDAKLFGIGYDENEMKNYIYVNGPNPSEEELNTNSLNKLFNINNKIDIDETKSSLKTKLNECSTHAQHAAKLAEISSIKTTEIKIDSYVIIDNYYNDKYKNTINDKYKNFNEKIIPIIRGIKEDTTKTNSDKISKIKKLLNSDKVQGYESYMNLSTISIVNLPDLRIPEKLNIKPWITVIDNKNTELIDAIRKFKSDITIENLSSSIIQDKEIYIKYIDEIRTHIRHVKIIYDVISPEQETMSDDTVVPLSDEELQSLIEETLSLLDTNPGDENTAGLRDRGRREGDLLDSGSSGRGIP